MLNSDSNIFRIAGFDLSDDTPPLFFAEIGAFFGQDVNLARSMIEQILDARNQVPQQPLLLKTEVLHDPEICLPGDTMETYASKNGLVKEENYRALIERKSLPLDKYAELFEMCTLAGLPFITSVYDLAGADLAAECGAVALKIASSNIIHVPLIRHCARKGVPIILDTGRATLAEVDNAITIATEAGCEKMVIQHSPDGHPALPRAHNLKTLETYQHAFGLPVGLSDHHVGLEMMYMAIAMGASVIEKGVHVAPDDLDIDISHTMHMSDLVVVMRSIFDCWSALGLSFRDMQKPIEGVLGTSQRQCLVANSDINAGDKISLENVRFAFPCRGISVEHWNLVEGEVLRRPVSAGRPVQWGDIEL
ncbi:MAG: spore coat protein [Betaproteobacteria bacterium]|nr:spore coat protein [Betaproteobacteria bacterium]